MERTWIDELDRTWNVLVDVPEGIDPTGDSILVFESEEGRAEDREIDALGPLEESFEALSGEQIKHALEAAETGVGLLLIDEERHLWWVRGPDAETMAGGWAVKFSDGEGEEYTHQGPLPDDPEALSEDELLELLDEARGRVMDPMDVRET